MAARHLKDRVLHKTPLSATGLLFKWQAISSTPGCDQTCSTRYSSLCTYINQTEATMLMLERMIRLAMHHRLRGSISDQDGAYILRPDD